VAEPWNAELSWEPITSDTAGPCAACGTETVLLDADLECHVCSETCAQQIWDEYCRATILRAIGGDR
jgi:hypothetical protein